MLALRTDERGAAAFGRPASGAPADVLHVVNSFFPGSTGGTEVYVQTLIAALGAHGVRGTVAVPGPRRAL